MNTKEVKVSPKMEDNFQNVSQKKTVTVPTNVADSWIRLMDGSWLNVNDDEEREANKLFVAGNLNISLICALLFTTFLPLYYNEAQRLNDSMDGFTIDIAKGYLSPLVVSKNFLHDLFDVAYITATAGTLFGTMVSVFFMLAANEANDDARTFVLVRTLGPHVSQLPFYFFSVGIIAWGFGVLVHVFIVPRLASGFYVKVFILSMIGVYLFAICFPRMIRGVFLGKLESQRHPPLHISNEKIAEALDKFFSNPEKDGHFLLPAFLRSLTYMTEHGYRPKLQAVTIVQATCMYYEKLAQITGRSTSEVREALENIIE